MQEFIGQEKDRLQQRLRLFNERGSRMEAYDDDGTRIFGELVDSYTVTRIAPHFDAQGHLTKTDFWLLWKSCGYNNGWQYAHTVKIVDVKVRDTLTEKVADVERQDWLIVDLSDDLGRRHHVEMIEPITERAYAADWKAWLKYKAENVGMFREIDSQLLAEHLKIAEEWS